MENVIEFFKDQESMTCSFSQNKFINMVRALATSYPEDVQIMAENEDGSIVAHIPVSYLILSNPKANGFN
jgi:hypothetical protein